MVRSYFHILFYFSFILIFFPMFVLYIASGTNGNILIGLFFLIALYISLLIFDNKRITTLMKRLIRLPIIKYYHLFMVFVLLTTIAHILLGTYTAPKSFYFVRIYKFFVATILVYYLPVLGFVINMKLKSIIKLYYIIIYGIIVASIIQYFGSIYNIGFINNIFSVLTNARSALYIFADIVKVNNRVFAFFGEPSGLGQFIFIVMPFILNLCTSPYKLFKNKYFNFIVKTTFIPLMLISIILTKSPIFLIFCYGEFVILFIIKHFSFIKKYIFRISFIFSITLIFLYMVFINSQADIEKTYLYRIILTIRSFGNFENLIEYEASLATRIVSYAMQLKAFTHNIFFGCGLGNIDVLVNSFFINGSPLPLTKENIFTYYNSNYTAGVNRSIFFTNLAEFGLIGFLLFYIFVIKNVLYVNKLKNIFKNINKVFLLSLFQSYICILVISIYNLNIQNSIMWLLFGFTTIYLYIYKNIYNRK